MTLFIFVLDMSAAVLHEFRNQTFIGKTILIFINASNGRITFKNLVEDFGGYVIIYKVT